MRAEARIARQFNPPPRNGARRARHGSAVVARFTARVGVIPRPSSAKNPPASLRRSVCPSFVYAPTHPAGRHDKFPPPGPRQRMRVPTLINIREPASFTIGFWRMACGQALAAAGHWGGATRRRGWIELAAVGAEPPWPSRRRRLTRFRSARTAVEVRKNSVGFWSFAASVTGFEPNQRIPLPRQTALDGTS